LRIIHTRGGGGWGGIKVYPPSKSFAKLVNKTAIKHRKGVPSPQNQKCSQHLYTLPPKIWQKPHGPSPWIFKPCASMIHIHKCKWKCCKVSMLFFLMILSTCLVLWNLTSQRLSFNKNNDEIFMSILDIVPRESLKNKYETNIFFILNYFRCQSGKSGWSLWPTSIQRTARSKRFQTW
jgi:hypothetical protein